MTKELKQGHNKTVKVTYIDGDGIKTIVYPKGQEALIQVVAHFVNYRDKYDLLGDVFIEDELLPHTIKPGPVDTTKVSG